MDIFESVKILLGIKSVPVNELNRRATLQPQSSGRVKKDPLEGIHISDEYKVVKKLLDEGCPVVFVTGNAGTGKSTLIEYLKTVLEKRYVVVAPTGVAALNVQGVTIHSFFRFPPRILNEDDIKLVSDRTLYKKLELLIIDEVSMVRCDLIDNIDKFFRKNRSSNEPFGGVQLLLVGDLFQLPPVASQREWNVLRDKGYESIYFFSSFSLQESLLTPYNLTKSYRQEDQSFINLLNKMRIAENPDSVVAGVNRRC
jgi:energy-coupling factor transporter ATP-binding protein EcfA2